MSLGCSAIQNLIQRQWTFDLIYDGVCEPKYLRFIFTEPSIDTDICQLLYTHRMRHKLQDMQETQHRERQHVTTNETFFYHIVITIGYSFLNCLKNVLPMISRGKAPLQDTGWVWRHLLVFITSFFIHSDPKWLYLLGFHLWINENVTFLVSLLIIYQHLGGYLKPKPIPSFGKNSRIII